MALAIWTGAVSDSFALAGNWNPAAIPADGDTLIYNDQATREMAGSIVAAKGFNIILDKSFLYSVGSLATPFEPALGIPTLIFLASTILKSYFDTSANGIVVGVVDTDSAKDDLVNLYGSMTNLTVRRGKVALAGGDATITGRLHVLGGGGGQGDVTIPAAVTLANAEISVDGGKLDCSSEITTIGVNGGELILDGIVGITDRLEIFDGTFYWDASNTTAAASTIALIEAFGGLVKTRTDRLGRTLTSCNMYGDANIDFEAGGHGMVVTNAIRAFGRNRPKFPIGSTYTAGI